MKILIIGSKGFIGKESYLHFKSQKQNEVWGCDVVVDYTSKNYLLIDATNSNFENIFQEHLFDICINCSGAASVYNSIQNPMRDYTLNTYNIFKILEAIRKHKPSCKFIHLSSAAVYGNPETLPVKEEQKLSPVSPYGCHKKSAEDICFEFHKYFNLHTLSLRIFSAYGKGLKKQLFWDLYTKSKKSDELTLYGTGNESRDFIYISDLVYAIDCIINNGKFNGSAINIANNEEIYIKDAASIFFNSIDWSGSFDFSGEQRAGDPINWVADISRLQSLGYQRKVSFEAGLNLYAKWLKNLK
jgi:UDP-glucose 4-epimerase